MTDIPHDHLGHPDLQALVRQCGGFDKIRSAWDRSNAEWQERRRAGLKTPPWPTAICYSITESARASKLGGKVMPRALAAFMLMTSSILVACWTGRSAGFSPLRMRPA